MSTPDLATRSTLTRSKLRVGSLIAIILVALALLFMWRITNLNGLPDIGDPFDVAAFADIQVADADNAFVLYRRAAARLTPITDPKYDTDPAVQARWLAANREALDLWRQGTECPEALYISPRAMNNATMLPVIQSLRDFSRLAVLEGKRLEAEGNMRGALDWYRAVIRSGNHSGRHGIWIERLVGAAIHSVGFGRLTQWATDPRVDPALLREAMAEVEATATRSAPLAEAIKADYVNFMNSVGDPRLMDLKSMGSDLPKIYNLPGGQAVMEDLPRIIKREPERSRRVARLLVAHWLAAAEMPADRQPGPAGSFPKNQSWMSYDSRLAELYRLDTSAPANARVLSPEELAGWWVSTVDAARYFRNMVQLKRAVARERTARAALLIALANECYKRDHGQMPATVQELIPAYLKTLPDGYNSSP